MLYLNRILFSFLFSLLFLASLQAQPVVTATLDTTSILIGDQVKLQLSAQFPIGMSVSPPDLSVLDSSSTIEILDGTKWDTVRKSPDILCQQSLTLTVFDSGAFYIPAIPFQYQEKIKKGTVNTNRLLIEVGTIEADSTALAPIKPIIQEPLKFEDFLPFIIGLLSLFILIGLGYWIYKKRKAKTLPPPPEIILPAHEIALKQLTELKAEKLWQQGEVKEYQSRLTHIVRAYIENRYDVQALESTTDEIIQQIKPLDVEEHFKTQLREMLQMADLVKFAKAKPPVDVHQRLMDEAEDFVIKTQKKIVTTESAD